MKYLVDANILSEPTKAESHPAVVAWLRRNEREIAVDPIILGEIQFGILLLPKNKRRKRLEQWCMEGIRRIHCLPWEAENGLEWASLLARLRIAARTMPIKDSFIAATALAHDLTIVTYNGADFEKAGVEIEDPFDFRTHKPRPS